MIDALNCKKDLLDIVENLNYKLELSKTVDDDYFEPGMMENLDQYYGKYDETSNNIVVKISAKGLRYDNQTQNLDRVFVGDRVEIIRDANNLYNPNNFVIKKDGFSFGNLPAKFCNALAPLYDKGYATVLESKVSYLERIKERSRYAQQGVLFVEINIKLRVI